MSNEQPGDTFNSTKLINELNPFWRTLHKIHVWLRLTGPCPGVMWWMCVCSASVWCYTAATWPLWWMRCLLWRPERGEWREGNWSSSRRASHWYIAHRVMRINMLQHAHTMIWLLTILLNLNAFKNVSISVQSMSTQFTRNKGRILQRNVMFMNYWSGKKSYWQLQQVVIRTLEMSMLYNNRALTLNPPHQSLELFWFLFSCESSSRNANVRLSVRQSVSTSFSANKTPK